MAATAAAGISTATPVEVIFGLALTTHRDKDLGATATSYFLYEGLIAAVAILFFRSTVQLSSTKEPVALRWFFAILLAVLAYCKKSYELIVAVELFSYAVPVVLLIRLQPTASTVAVRLLSVAASAMASLLLSHLMVTGGLGNLAGMFTPSVVVRTLHYLFPVNEMKAAYKIMEAFHDPEILAKQAHHLLFVTFHIQVGMGYIGIDFLRKEQHRRNQLVRLDVADKVPVEDTKSIAKDKSGKVSTKMERAERFQRTAAPFILFTALPYMFQIIFFGNINKFSFSCVQHDLHRQVRLNQLFDHDNHLLSLATETTTLPGGM